MNPWVALVLGILIGWLLEWLVELFFFRRERLACQRRLGELEAQLLARDGQLRAANARINDLEIDASRLGAGVTLAAPAIAAPDLDVHLPDLDLEAPDLDVRVPDLDLEAPDLDVRVPDFDLKAPDLSLEAPDLPDISLRAGVPGVLAGAAAGAAAGGLDDGLTRRKTIRCPQDLSLIHGIGTVFEQRLYNAGIGSFWDLSQAGDDFVSSVLGALMDIDLPSIKAHALRLAEQTGTTGYYWDGTRPDDFEPLPGIGEVYESRLYQAGICTFEALAECTIEQLQAICKAPDWRKPPYAEWIAQAKRLARQGG